MCWGKIHLSTESCKESYFSAGTEVRDPGSWKHTHLLWLARCELGDRQTWAQLSLCHLLTLWPGSGDRSEPLFLLLWNGHQNSSHFYRVVVSTKGEDKTCETPSQVSGTLCVAPLVGAFVHDYLGGEQPGSLPLHWLDLGKMLGPRRPCPSPGEGNWPILNSGEHCLFLFQSLRQLCRSGFYPHFTDVETDSQWREVKHPRPTARKWGAMVQFQTWPQSQPCSIIVNSM